MVLTAEETKILLDNPELCPSAMSSEKWVGKGQSRHMGQLCEKQTAKQFSEGIVLILCTLFVRGNERISVSGATGSTEARVNKRLRLQALKLLENTSALPGSSINEEAVDGIISDDEHDTTNEGNH